MRHIPGRQANTPVQEMTGTFTGRVLADPLLSPDEGAGILSVLFTPGARTHWHRHERGQVLHVTGGAGWVVTRGGEAAAVRAGDVVWAPPGETHWHGADESSFLHHLAVSLGATEWAEAVDDADYAAVMQGGRGT